MFLLPSLPLVARPPLPSSQGRAVHASRLLLLSAAVLLSGAAACADPTPCERYVLAVGDCFGAAFDADAVDIVDCSEQDSGEAVDALFGCYAQAYETGTCTTIDGRSNIAEAVRFCNDPGDDGSQESE